MAEVSDSGAIEPVGWLWPGGQEAEPCEWQGCERMAAGVRDSDEGDLYVCEEHLVSEGS